MLTLINISGDDRPGLTAEITALLSAFSADILDVGQAVIHNHLSLGILVSLADVEGLKTRAQELGIDVKFTAIDVSSYEEWVRMKGKDRYILTLLARRIRADQLAAVSEVISTSGLNIDNITRLSGRVSLSDEDANTKASIEFSLRGEPDEAFQSRLVGVCTEHDIDIAVQEDNIFRRHRRLVAFDMDSTLIDTEVIDEMAEMMGVGEAVAGITERAMQGELDFSESLRERVSLLSGMPETDMQKIAARLPLMEGATHLIHTLSRLGYKTAILSGGFHYFGEVLQKKLGIDYVFANKLEIVAGKLTGNVVPPIVDAARKAELLKSLAERENISLQQVVAVGDGANDLAMLQKAGLGIAFHAKPFLKENAKQSISTLGLDSILYLMGIRDRDALH